MTLKMNDFSDSVYISICININLSSKWYEKNRAIEAERNVTLFVCAF